MNAKRFDQIFDIHTRTRLLNQRESMKLNEKIKDLSVEKYSTIYRHVLDENDLKIKLHKFSYENGQRNLYKFLSQHSNERTSTSLLNLTEQNEFGSTDKFNILNTSHSSMESPSLLMHDLTASIELEKYSSRSSLNNKINPYEQFCNQYSSKLESSQYLHQKPIHMTLKQYSDRMNLNIKIAIARSSRNFHTGLHRKARLY